MEEEELIREEIAIFAVRDLLIELLQNKKWCKAKRVGRALELLFEDRGDQPMPAVLNEPIVVRGQ